MGGQYLMSDDDKDDAIFKVDTVPPPAGEDNAYNAPTRVGAMAAAVVEEMMVASVRKANALTAAASEKAAASQKAAAAEASAAAAADAVNDSDLVPEFTPASPGMSAPKPPQPGVMAKPPPVPQKSPVAPPRLYDEADQGEDAATLLGPSARAPVVAPFAPPPQAPFAPPPARAIAPPPPASPLSFGPTAPALPTRSTAPLPPRSPLPALLPLVIGFAIFAIGVALYYWVR